MKDDERYLLGAAQEAGEVVRLPAMKEDRHVYLLKVWDQLGWVTADGSLTEKGLATHGGIAPETIPIEPTVVELEVAVPELPDVYEEDEVEEEVLDEDE